MSPERLKRPAHPDPCGPGSGNPQGGCQLFSVQALVVAEFDGPPLFGGNASERLLQIEPSGDRRVGGFGAVLPERGRPGLLSEDGRGNTAPARASARRRVKSSLAAMPRTQAVAERVGSKRSAC